jgi:hypothetical protein
VDWIEGRFALRGDDLEAEGGLSLDGVLSLFSATAAGGEPLPWVVEEHKRSGVPVYRRGHVTVVDSGQQGCYATITGQGCRELEADGVVLDWVQFTRSLVAADFDCRRFDHAWDAYGGLLPFEEIKTRIEDAAKSMMAERSFVSQARSVGGEWSGGYDKPYGYTLYVGRRTSETMLRIYDRASLLRGQGVEIGENEQITRAELEWKRERAQSALLAFAGYRVPTVAEFIAGQSDWVSLGVSGAAAVVGVLCSHLDFKIVGSATRIERCDSEPWWERFTDLAEKSRLYVRKLIRTVERNLSWLWRQCAPGMAVAVAAYGREVLDALVVDGQMRVDKADRKGQKVYRKMLDQHARNENAWATAKGDGSGDVDDYGEIVPPLGSVVSRTSEPDRDPSVQHFSPALGRWWRPGVAVPV